METLSSEKYRSGHSAPHSLENLRLRLTHSGYFPEYHIHPH